MICVATVWIVFNICRVELASFEPAQHLLGIFAQLHTEMIDELQATVLIQPRKQRHLCISAGRA